MNKNEMKNYIDNILKNNVDVVLEIEKNKLSDLYTDEIYRYYMDCYDINIKKQVLQFIKDSEDLSNKKIKIDDMYFKTKCISYWIAMVISWDLSPNNFIKDFPNINKNKVYYISKILKENNK